MSYDVAAILLKLADAEVDGTPLFPELRVWAVDGPRDWLGHSRCAGGRCIIPHLGNCRGRGWVPEWDPERAAYRVSVVLSRGAEGETWVLHHSNGESVWFDTDGMHETHDPVEADLSGGLAWAQARMEASHVEPALGTAEEA